MSEPTTRRALLDRAVVTGGSVAVGATIIAALPDGADSRPSPARDAEILNFALLFEYVQAGLYAQALAKASLEGELRTFARVVGRQERRHVAFLRDALGGKARKPPTLDFGDDTSSPEAFTEAALKLEDLSVAAYNAQAPALSDAALASAARIVSVEARHAAWIRAIAGLNPAPDASEPTLSAKRVMDTLEGSGYVR